MRNTACQAIRRPLPVTRHPETLVWSLHPVVRAAAGTNACRPLLRGYYPFQPVRLVYLAEGSRVIRLENSSPGSPIAQKSRDNRQPENRVSPSGITGVHIDILLRASKASPREPSRAERLTGFRPRDRVPRYDRVHATSRAGRLDGNHIAPRWHGSVVGVPRVSEI